MKNKLIGMAALAVSTCLMSFAPSTENTYTVSGNISGLADSTVLTLTPVSHDNDKPLAEVMAMNGKFTFTGTATDSICVRLGVKDTYGGINLMLENRNITVNAQVTVSKSYDGTPFYHFDQTEIKGSPMTIHYQQLASVRDSMDVLFQAYHKKYADIEQKISKARAEKDQKALDALRNTDEYKAFNKAESDFFHTVETSYNQVILGNKDTFWGPLMLINLTSYLSPDQKGIYEQFSQAAKDSYYGKKVKDELYPAGTTGQKVPFFTTKDATGKEVSLSSMLEGKKYLLIDFWASWCGPCRKEIPNLKNLYAKYKDKGFQIVSISIDKKEADWQKALKEEGLVWLNFRDGNVADLYKVRAVPTMYLVDAQGVIVGENLRGEALASRLAELLQ